MSTSKGKSVSTPAPSVMGDTPSSTQGEIFVVPQQIKVSMPDTFDGNRSKLKAFLSHCDLYLGFNSAKYGSEVDKVLWIITLLRGAAFDWIEPFLTDYMDHRGDTATLKTNMTLETRDTLRSVTEFKAKIGRVFGDIDEERTAVRRIQNLRQKGSAATYTAEFQQYSGKTGWGDNALRDQYYRGLRDDVKDEIARSERPDTFQGMIDMAVKVDNRMFERRLEKKGQYRPESKKRNKGNYWPQPMELDAATIKKKLPKEVMEKRRRDKLCFECGLPGHIASSHKKKNGKFGRGRRQVALLGRSGEVAIRRAAGRRRAEERQREYLERWARHEQQDELALRQQEENEVARAIQVPEEESSGDERYEDALMEQLVRDHQRESPSPEDVALPQEGEIWSVVLFVPCNNRSDGCRIWENIATGTQFQEPGLITSLRGPSEGNFEVKYRDDKRIGWWSPEETYMLRFDHSQPEEVFLQEQPEEGELWELYMYGRLSNMWESTDRPGIFYHELIAPNAPRRYLREKGVYSVEVTVRGQRLWKNILDGSEYREEGVEDLRQLCATGDHRQLFFWVVVEGKVVQAMMDSGAQGNFISPDIAVLHRFPTQVKEDPYQLTVVDGTSTSYQDGNVNVETEPLVMITPSGHTEEIQFDVTEIGQHQIILGMPWLQKHNPTVDWKTQEIAYDRCNCHWSQFKPREISAISGEQEHLAQGSPMKQIPLEYKQFEELFKEETGIEALPQHQEWDHEIPLVEGAKPPFQPIYTLAQDDLRTLKQWIDENLAKGFIRESTSPYGAPILFVPKKDGTKRLCVDYRKLNDLTIKDRYALPLPDELRDRLQGANFFTKLDLRGAYNLVRIKEGEEYKTAFRTRYGHYETLVMPFGLTNAPATCQRLLNNTLIVYLDVCCICYLDDILVYSKDLAQHRRDVTNVLTALGEAKLRLKPEKCEFHKKEVTFLGYVVSTTGIKMDPAKVETVLKWQAPTKVKEVQSFLGFANFYRRFIRGYSAIAAPLTALTRKDKEFEWTNEAQQAFDTLKEYFAAEPVLASFDPTKEIRVETDSSDYAIGAVLSQPNEQGR